MCDVDQEAVVTAADAPSIYDIPKVLHREGLDAYVVRRLDLPFRDVDWTAVGRPAAAGAPPQRGGHRRAGRQVHRPARRLPLGRRGAARRRLRPRGPGQHRVDPLRRVRDPRRAPHAASPTSTRSACPGGFGIRGIEGKLGALTYARTHKIPTLGLCLGLQCMVIEYARSVAGLDKAASTEFDPDCPEPVIATMAEQHAFVEGAGDLGGTMRLGPLPGRAQGGHASCGRRTAPRTSRSGTGTATRSTTPTATSSRQAGLVFSGTSPDNNLVEFVELPADVHPYYVATQAHPELRSRPTRPHPLFAGLVGAAIQRQRELLIPIDESALRRRWVADDDVTMDKPDGGTSAEKTGDPALDRA